MAVPAKRRKASRPKHSKGSNSAWLDDQSVRGWGNEVLAVLCFASALLIGLSSITSVGLAFFTADGFIGSLLKSAHEGLGFFGSVVGTNLVRAFGLGSFVIVTWLAWFGWALWRLDETISSFSFSSFLYRLVGVFSLTAIVCAIFSVIFSSTLMLGDVQVSYGGALGAKIAAPLTKISGNFGALLVLTVFLVAGVSIATKKTVGEVISWSWDLLKWSGENLLVKFPVLAAKWSIMILGGLFSLTHLIVRLFSQGWEAMFSGPVPAAETLIPLPRKTKSTSDGFELGIGSEKNRSKKSEAKSKLEIEVFDDEETEESPDILDEILDNDEDETESETFSHVVVSRRANKSIPVEFSALTTKTDSTKPSENKKPKKTFVEEPEQDFSGYKKPEFDLLTRSEEIPPSEDDDELIQKSRQIELKLRDFNIQGRVTEVHPGPVITLFEFEPAAGVKVGKIAALQDDLAMSLRASSIRIIAPIPKKGTVGIEVPNRNRDMVRLRDVLEHPDFLVNPSLLNIPLGKDTYGDPVYVDIATMPHLLIAGATGTGKSVSINAILLSLLYRASPADLGLILIDPKILELSIYDGIPHLKVPVVTVPKQAKAVLDWAVKEMERRYRMMQKYGVRNIDGYNKIVAGLKESEAQNPKAAEEQLIALKEDQIVSLDQDLTELDLAINSSLDPLAENSTENPEDDKVKVAEPLKSLPKIVIVVDELADLMLTVGRDIEELITRLAQKARAAGIHLILATQRPSVDVITGLIKANFPARISFRVTSRIDSRTILDSMGSERLLGKGDMLFMHPGSQHLRRVHGAFVSDNEVQKVVDSIKSQAEPNYDQKIMDMCDKALREDTEGAQGASGEYGEDETFDPLYDKAVEVVVQKGQASTSMIQRVFRIGYNRAARIIECMEREGVIGPMDGIKPREVLVNEVGKGQI